jgi:hypothetical protein
VKPRIPTPSAKAAKIELRDDGKNIRLSGVKEAYVKIDQIEG